MSIAIKSNPNCECAYCRNDLPFELPQEIIDATLVGNLVIFAGAGISTEGTNVFKETLYEDVLSDLEKAPSESLDFPSLMSLYCSSNVNGRQKLLQKIKFRFDYCQQFSELYRDASEFHRELSSLYYIKTIITTNWDDYFERESGSVPITTPEDFAFYNLPDRKVFKIHGSITNYGTIIATKEDYDKCYKDLNKGILGSYLKTILATKTVVFIGYSFKDYDFLKIYSYLKKEMRELIPHIYIVTLDEKIENENATIINTDGAFFLASLRKHLEGISRLMPKENIENIYFARIILSRINTKTSDRIISERQANLVYCTFYQDGIKHAFDYLIFHAHSGLSFYPNKVFDAVDSYKILRKEKLKVGNYADVAYIDGYIQGIKAIVYQERHFKSFPYWYLFGVGPIFKEQEFNKSIKKKEIFHKGAEAYGKRYFKNALSGENKITLHHTPFL
jgi:NAD-dependent SIR2 family protein deacetylase